MLCLHTIVGDLLRIEEHVSRQKRCQEISLTPRDTSLELAVSGSAWLGKGDISIWTMIEECVSAAEEEISIAAYSVSENSYMIFDLIEKVLQRGLRVLILINRLNSQPPVVKSRLISLNDNFLNLKLLSFEPSNKAEDLHAKIIVIDRSIALIGSANLTWKGLVNNHEIMLRFNGNTAWKLGNLIDRLSSNTSAKLLNKKQW